MGRSVETVGHCPIYFDACDLDSDDWCDLLDNIRYALKARYKSFEVADDWVKYPHRENRIILENDLVCVSISEYCGCGAISIFCNDRYEYEYHALGHRWIDQNHANIASIIGDFVNTLNRVGTFSNGCGVFEKNNS